MDTAQWPQEIVVKSMEEIVVPNGSTTSCSKPGSSLERKVRPQKEQALNCPRCNSINTKFCYYNNYSLSQPRYFCKTCRRYWTEGGSLRNIPVGGGSRKNKRSSSSSSSSSSSVSSSKKLPDLIPPSSHQNPKIHEGQDLNLGFSSSHDFKTITELIQVPNFDSNNKENLTSSSSNSTTTSCHLSALELLTGITPIRGLSSFVPMPITTDPTVVYSSSGGFQLPEFKPSLSFSLDGLGSSGGYGNLHGVQESSGGRPLFPFEDLKQVSGTTSTDVDQQNRDQHADSTGYWTGVLGGGGGSW
ncbi:unnamed protein product [Coffea canephora]|uniref:Dof zinc finger protein n=1 Tax=Coffea canephora TaxID=49390 RepID=A0A068UV02_COFCA|nr:unnamed protein product [Coffea canephora]